MPQWVEMSFLVYMIVAVVGSSLVSAVSLHIGAALVGSVLGSDDSLDSGAINGCTWWPWSVIVSGIAAALLWSRLGTLGLVSILTGPLLTIVLAGISLRATSAAESRNEFTISDGTVLSTREDKVYRPDHFISSSGYYTTGPASGYEAYCIELRDDNGDPLATNNYLSEQQYREDSRRLAHELRHPTLDVILAFKSDEGEAFDSLPVSGELLSIMVKHQRTFPPESLRWWTALLTPNLREGQVLEFPAREVVTHLAPFTRYGLDPITESSVISALDLLRKEQSEVRIMHWDTYLETMEGV
jgi:hypothetical protein